MNVRVLALDTTGEFGSLALASEGRVVEEVLLHSPGGFAHVLFQQVESLLRRHGWPLESIDVFAAAAGPGSFTGVRVGLAAVKGLAETAGKAAVAVSNLAATASYGAWPLRAAFLDARRGEVYAAVYDERLHLRTAETVTTFPKWLESLPLAEIGFVSSHLDAFRTALAGSRFAGAPAVEAPRALAGAVSRIAGRKYLAGEAADPAAIDANYVRRSDAELFWRDERG